MSKMQETRIKEAFRGLAFRIIAQGSLVSFVESRPVSWAFAAMAIYTLAPCFITDSLPTPFYQR